VQSLCNSYDRKRKQNLKSSSFDSRRHEATGWFSVVVVIAWSYFQCFDTVVWETGLAHKTCAFILLVSSLNQLEKQMMAANDHWQVYLETGR